MHASEGGCVGTIEQKGSARLCSRSLLKGPVFLLYTKLSLQPTCRAGEAVLFP